jgi:hypothetical protein
MAVPNLTAEAIRKAIQEYDELGAERFLAKYGYGHAREYFVVVDGRRYDSKAIAGVAHGYLDGSGGALRTNQFSGDRDNDSPMSLSDHAPDGRQPLRRHAKHSPTSSVMSSECWSSAPQLPSPTSTVLRHAKCERGMGA